MNLDTLLIKTKEKYSLTEEECLLLNYFIQTKGHSLTKHELTHHVKFHCNELNGKNIFEIMTALMGKTNNKIICLHNDKYTLTDNFKEEFKGIDITYITPAIIIEKYDGATEAMQSLNDIFISEQNILYIFLAITPHEAFEKLQYRIDKKLKTIFFMSHKDCFCHKLEKKEHKKILEEWIKFINKNEYVEFYLVRNYKKNDTYRFLYSSLLARNTVRFNAYKYKKNGEAETRVGNLLECKMNENSLYDIAERGYTDAWNERMGVRKINKLTWVRRGLANNFYKILFSALAITAGIILNIYSDSFLGFLKIFSAVFGAGALILSLAKDKISKIRKEKLEF